MKISLTENDVREAIVDYIMSRFAITSKIDEIEFHTYDKRDFAVWEKQTKITLVGEEQNDRKI